VDQIKWRSRQRRHVERLAYMAGGIGPIGMPVENGAAYGKIQQRGTTEQRQPSARHRSSEHQFMHIHLATH
jgi:hypothetical protein